MTDETMKIWLSETNIDPAMAWINDIPSREQLEWYGNQIAIASEQLRQIVLDGDLNSKLFEPQKPLWIENDLSDDGIEISHSVFHQFLYEIDSMRRKAWKAVGHDDFLPRTQWIPPAFNAVITA